jgi:site-specific DNA recombinase
MTSPRKLRCAIYTRKSSEEGLDQDFNSLDAQREACAAYIQSQRHEGWTLLPTRYDDGGYSGGTLERPALQHLLAAINAGDVDLIVVYKVDRLTRSLNDFAKIVERLDAQSASFVSVTQSFNTTTSMGRLTLNVLLSFAQFEREVTGERIRDKIAASKKKGMWMGGRVPLGYDGVDRKLVVNAKEAESVRRLFTLYRELGNVARLRKALAAEGIVSKQRRGRDGVATGGGAFSNGALFTILDNRLYRGEITHKGQVNAGQHAAIIPDDLWQAVRDVREKTCQRTTGAARAQARSPLRGLITDDLGRRYEAVHTTKGGKRYRYYVSMKEGDAGDPERKQARLPAEELEHHVAARLDAFFGSANELHSTIGNEEDTAQHRHDVMKAAKAFTLPAEDVVARWALYRSFIQQVVVRPVCVDMIVNRAALRDGLTKERRSASDVNDAASVDTFTLTIPIGLYRTGHDLRLVINSGAKENEAGKRDVALIRLVARGRRWYEQLTSGDMPSLRAIANAEGLAERYVARVLAGSLLAPDLIDKIVQGWQPVHFTVESLRRSPPLEWDEQRRRFGVTAR